MRLLLTDDGGVIPRLSYSDEGIQIYVNIRVPTLRAALRICKLKVRHAFVDALFLAIRRAARFVQVLGFFNLVLNRYVYVLEPAAERCFWILMACDDEFALCFCFQHFPYSTGSCAGADPDWNLSCAVLSI